METSVTSSNIPTFVKMLLEMQNCLECNQTKPKQNKKEQRPCHRKLVGNVIPSCLSKKAQGPSPTFPLAPSCNLQANWNTGYPSCQLYQECNIHCRHDTASFFSSLWKTPFIGNKYGFKLYLQVAKPALKNIDDITMKNSQFLNNTDQLNMWFLSFCGTLEHSLKPQTRTRKFNFIPHVTFQRCLEIITLV